MPITRDQVKAALDLYREHLPNWRLSDSTLEASDKDLDSVELCLTKVVLVDTLYSTGLRFAPGARERTARYLYDRRESLITKVTVDTIEQLAGAGSNQKKFLSFASKFCHFYLCDRFPIFDRDSCSALRHFELEPRNQYSEFFTTLSKLQSELRLSFREIDRFLWLFGRYLRWNPNSKANDEVSMLFKQPNCAEQILLKRMELPKREANPAASTPLSS
jgi:hypothetical protein